MAAPKFVPLDPTEVARVYTSPDNIPEPWIPDRPGEVYPFQPQGDSLGYQGPDQGYALTIAERVAERLVLQPGEHRADAIRGCLGIALRRASIYGRAPVIHDVTLAFTIWGFLDPAPPAELLALRKQMFANVGHGHHYAEARAIADAVPEPTLRMTPAEIVGAYPLRWRELLG